LCEQGPADLKIYSAVYAISCKWFILKIAVLLIFIHTAVRTANITCIILFNVLSLHKRKVEESILMRSVCPTSAFNQAEPLTSNLMWTSCNWRLPKCHTFEFPTITH